MLFCCFFARIYWYRPNHIKVSLIYSVCWRLKLLFQFVLCKQLELIFRIDDELDLFCTIFFSSDDYQN